MTATTTSRAAKFSWVDFTVFDTLTILGFGILASLLADGIAGFGAQFMSLLNPIAWSALALHGILLATAALGQKFVLKSIAAPRFQLLRDAGHEGTAKIIMQNAVSINIIMVAVIITLTAFMSTVGMQPDALLLGGVVGGVAAAVFRIMRAGWLAFHVATTPSQERVVRS